MTKIVLTKQQLKTLTEANGGEIIVVDDAGNHLGWVERRCFTDEEVAAAEKRLEDGGPWYTTEQVLAHLRSLAPE